MPSGARSQPSPEREPLSQGELERDWTLRLIERFDALVLRPSIDDPQEFFLQLAKQLKETFEAELVRVWDYNPQGQYLALQQSYPDHDLSGTSFTIDVKHSFTGVAIQQATMVTFSDLARPVENRRFQNPAIVEELGLGSLICIPVFGPTDTDIPMFVMDLFFRTEPPESFTSHRRAIDWLTSALGRALDYLRYGIGDRVRRSVENSNLAAAGVSGLFDGVFEEMQQLTRCSRATIFRVDTTSQQLILERSGGASEHHVDKRDVVLPPNTYKACVQSKKSLISRETIATKSKQIQERWALMAAPIISSSNDVIAVLVCDGNEGMTQGKSFSSTDLLILEDFARAMAPATERFLRDREDSRLTKILKEVASRVARSTEVEDILQGAVEVVCISLGAELGSIYLLGRDAEGKEALVLRAGTGPFRELVGIAQYSLGEGLTGYIATGRTINFRSWEECKQHPHWKGKYDELLWKDKKARESNTLLGLPISIGNRVLGVWKFENIRVSRGHAHQYFTDEDTEVVRALSSFLSFAIEHHRYKTTMSHQFKLLARSCVHIEKARTEEDAILAVMTVLEESGWSDVMLSLYDSSARQIKGKIGSGKFQPHIVDLAKVSIDNDNVLAEALKENRAVFIRDSERDPRCNQQIVKAASIVAQYVLPLRLDDELIGAIQVVLRGRAKIEPDEELVLQAFANFLAVTMSRIRRIHESMELTNQVLSGSRFIVAETLSAMAVHSVDRELTFILDQLKVDLKKKDIKDKELLHGSMTSWRNILERAQKDLRNALSTVRAQSGEASTLNDVHPLIQQSVNTWINYIKQHNCTVEIETKASRSACRIGSHAFKEIVTVLVVNAIQAFAHNIAITTCNKTNVETERNFIESAFCLECSDDGHGLSTNNPEEIFKPTYTTKSEKFGTGLGLYIARLLACNAGGDLVVAGSHSKPKGVTFLLTLPLGEEV